MHRVRTAPDTASMHDRIDAWQAAARLRAPPPRLVIIESTSVHHPAMPTRPSVLVLTGAGISADSGIPTFRDAGGLWEGQRVEDVATPEAWARNPRLVWRFYQLRRQALASVSPNPAHEALVRFEARLSAVALPFLLVTQNVDDLHERAGSPTIHMHGELTKVRCEACGTVVPDEARFHPDAPVPCPRCGHEWLRPDVVWFGEMPAHLDLIYDRLASVTHFLALGTSGLVHPAASFLAEARGAGARTFIQSLDPPANLHPRDEFRPGRAALVVPGLLDEIASALEAATT